MPGCCVAFENSANRQFNEKKAKQELKRYRENGPGATARLIEAGVARAGWPGGTLLDVGSGIGALTFSLLEKDATSAIAIDASSSYLAAAREEAIRRKQERNIRFIHADFAEAAAGLPAASLVTLDRVVCCYPECERLLDAAAAHAEHCIALSYPRNVWYVRLGMSLENGQRRITGNPFRTFVHSAESIAQTIRRAGFALACRLQTRMWCADAYRRR